MVIRRPLGKAIPQRCATLGDNEGSNGHYRPGCWSFSPSPVMNRFVKIEIASRKNLQRGSLHERGCTLEPLVNHRAPTKSRNLRIVPRKRRKKRVSEPNAQTNHAANHRTVSPHALT